MTFDEIADLYITLSQNSTDPRWKDFLKECAIEVLRTGGSQPLRELFVVDAAVIV